jgi:cell division septal protein FtsQ
MEYERLKSLQKIHRKRVIKTKINRSILALLSRTTLYLLLLFLLILGVQEGAKHTLNYLRTTAFFALKTIEVYGINRLSEENVIKLANIEQNINILTIDLNEIDERVRKNPWVEHLRLRRILPGKLRITLFEKRAYAVIKYDAPFFVTKSGDIIKKLSPGEAIDLPVITGLNSKEQLLIKNALHVLSNPNIQKTIPLSQIGEVNFQDHRISLFTISPPIKILADTRLLKDQFYRLKFVLSALQKKEIIPRQIDLNYSKKVVVKLDNSQ